jgi:hypothetical protein
MVVFSGSSQHDVNQDENCSQFDSLLSFVSHEMVHSSHIQDSEFNQHELDAKLKHFNGVKFKDDKK